jgi:hypothetical protein
MSAGVAALIAQIVFWGALLVGWLSGELSPRSTIVFAVLWLAIYAASSYVPQGDYLFPSFVALLDIVLVLVIFKADIRLT